jgi:murein DD-endopeptidase MepM/ murein hydrolase activator NlpD
MRKQHTTKPINQARKRSVRERLLGNQSQMTLPPQLKGYSYSIEKGLKKPIKSKLSTVRLVSVVSSVAVLPFAWWLSNSNALVVDNIQATQPSIAETSAPEQMDAIAALAKMETIYSEFEPEANVIAPPIVEKPVFTPWLDIKVKSGDNLSTIFSRHGLSKTHLYQIVNIDKKSAKTLRQLRPDQKMRIKRDKQGNIEEFILDLGFASELYIAQTETGFNATFQQGEVTSEIATAYGQVTSTLFNAGYQAGLPDSLMSNLMEIFRWDEDFHTFQKGDHFTVVYEKFTYDSESQFGDILAVEVFNGNQFHQAIRYTDEQGKTSYYYPDGKPLFAQAKPSVKKLNPLMIPVKNARISSKYGMRVHPISGKYRFHSGVDYAATTGTPIFAASSSTVKFKGWQRGYGWTVVLQHDDEQYSSLYAHMSKFADIEVGQKIKQGVVIGYIGQSGSATGPHLHYEVRLDNQPQNPLALQIPNEAYEKQLAELKKQEAQRKKHFIETTQALREQLTIASRKTYEALGIQHRSSTLAKAAGVED